MVENVRIVPTAPDAVRVIQITDTHIPADPATRFAGVDTDATLAAVVRALNAHVPAPDCVLLTGDLVDVPSEAAYSRLVPHLQRIDAPVFCLPGNHDEPALMRAVLNRDRARTPGVIDSGAWRIVMLDTWEQDEQGGRLARPELDRLGSALSDADECHALICLHHPPCSIGSPWMDAMSLANPEDFFAVTGAFDNVRGVVFGHIHQEFVSEHNRVPLFGTPSTCVQFLPRAGRYIVEGRPPGYRELLLHRDGRVQTRVLRVPPENRGQAAISG